MIKLDMDVYMLLSIVNMKLRNNYKTLEALCDDQAIDQTALESKLATINYYYELDKNQFKSHE